jgi:hypothetical protein
MKIGALPRMALTGFSGPNEGGSEFEARGANTRGQGLNQMHLAVVVRGSVAPDGETVAGKIFAVINGADQSDWSFVGAVTGADLPEAIAITGTGAVGVSDETAIISSAQEAGPLARAWQAVPPALKIAAGVGLAAVGGTYLYRRTQG